MPSKVRNTVVPMNQPRAVLFDAGHRTWALNLVVLFHLLAIACAGLCLWVSKRDYRKPTPRIEVLW